MRVDNIEEADDDDHGADDDDGGGDDSGDHLFDKDELAGLKNSTSSHISHISRLLVKVHPQLGQSQDGQNENGFLCGSLASMFKKIGNGSCRPALKSYDINFKVAGMYIVLCLDIKVIAAYLECF